MRLHNAFEASEYRELGKSGILVSPLGFGASPLGGVFGPVNEEEGIRAVHKAWREGINFFDCSPYYGFTKAEKVLGLGLRDLPRESVVVATKVGRYGPSEFDFSPSRIESSVKESMERLNVNYLDVVQCHDIEFGDLRQVVEESLPLLESLKRRGIIRAIGVTGLPLHIYDYVISNSKVKLDLVLSYCHGCLNDTSLVNILPFLKENDLGVVNASPLSMGLLTIRGAPEWHPAPPELRSAARKAAKVCEEHGADIAELALQFAYQLEGVTCTLVGIDGVKNLLKDIDAVHKVIDQVLLQKVLEIFEPVHNITWFSGHKATE
ncbi:D-threo-aldose 1-dehydrogenase [Galdieria sulphuraria]|uniref:D-threo-aldose 1-dehydrogenase n=1 Tax=Galdieria sulphuraria TaxID=130081 RepID=M2Y4G6_GALSU|nr:D-threo-aldose 1-dehydrogenase [Galdieria sulphuraria]EME30734.1 D-threo-aldose 1-dehydrogenase [Galdieria sulphuraria]|eukprot:XP_005707254.1 D-threo-aldose 1-dehydrogenase [Galdieria sulphuraria]